MHITATIVSRKGLLCNLRLSAREIGAKQGEDNFSDSVFGRSAVSQIEARKIEVNVVQRGVTTRFAHVSVVFAHVLKNLKIRVKLNISKNKNNRVHTCLKYSVKSKNSV